ncbi:MAG: 2-oxo acid dehydrogenase subunit E2 [Kiritimatiellae bacterium]|nr:2-oxo acid dehydrogenase subunit E2 [Kiritimatiellia bacterium]MDW8458112.1 dihydrolipoamide acetyltransferase family protein [Verrucomicrobiota bacterium]
MAVPIIMPRQGQSVESCILVKWLVKPGDTVVEGQPVASIETDKATFEVPAPAGGTVVELFFPEGADIPVLTHIGAIGAPGEDVSALRPAGAAPAAAPAPASPAPGAAASPATAAPAPKEPAAPSGSVGVSPRARKASARAGIDPSALAGSGPGGRVIERDVLAAAATVPPLTAAARAAGASTPDALPRRGSGLGGRITAADRLAPPEAGAAAALEPAAIEAGTKREIPVKGIRKIIADRMRQSLSTTAQLTLHARADLSVVQAFRARAKAQGEAFGLPKLTINDLVCYAALHALKKHPSLNAHFLGDRIVEFGAVNLGVAVDTPRGLMVPVIHGADRLSIAALSAAIRERAEACQAGSINPDLLTGGTFTVTNLGALGIDYFTPVLNAPEVAILGVGGISLQPARRPDGSVAFVETISFSLTIDHQAVDGAPAARFLQDLVAAIEHIDLLLAAPPASSSSSGKA